jgi:AbrB family looped-hinge helix DNA binding protein
MAKVTSKYQVTLPRAIADRYDIHPGDRIDWVAAGEVIRAAYQLSLFGAHLRSYAEHYALTEILTEGFSLSGADDRRSSSALASPYPIFPDRRELLFNGAGYPIKQNWSSANNTTDSTPFASAKPLSFSHGVV